MQYIPAHGDAAYHGVRVPFLVFRPSLLNIASLGSPAEVVKLFELVMSDQDSRVQVIACMGILMSCADDKDLACEAVGYHDGLGLYEPGEMPLEHIIHMARHMLLHGMIGDVDIPAKTGVKPKPMTEFKAADFVAMAIAHLGMSQADAWGLSMTALVAALNSKFPQVKEEKAGSDAPSIEEYEEAMEWFDKIRGN